MPKCTFLIAWVGRCGKECTGGFCAEHEGVKCRVCGKQATHDCSHTGSFVCGTPLCSDCEGYHDGKGPNHRPRDKDTQ